MVYFFPGKFLRTGKADRRLCEVILCELKQAVTKTTDEPVRQVFLCCG